MKGIVTAEEEKLEIEAEEEREMMEVEEVAPDASEENRIGDGSLFPAMTLLMIVDGDSLRTGLWRRWAALLFFTAS